MYQSVLFSEVKSVLKANEDTWKDFGIEKAVLAAFITITLPIVKLGSRNVWLNIKNS